MARCDQCGNDYDKTFQVISDGQTLTFDSFECAIQKLAPTCPHCGALLRPDVVWFGEGLPTDVWDNAFKAVCAADVLLVAGTSSVVYPAASLAPFAKQSGAIVIEINPDETPISPSVDYSIRGKAGEVLPQLLE